MGCLMDTKTPDPVGSKYAGAVSRESVRIAFTYAALKMTLMCAWQTSGMPYLQSPTSQKHYIICGPRVWNGKMVGKVGNHA